MRSYGYHFCFSATLLLLTVISSLVAGELAELEGCPRCRTKRLAAGAGRTPSRVCGYAFTGWDEKKSLQWPRSRLMQARRPSFRPRRQLSVRWGFQTGYRTAKMWEGCVRHTTEEWSVSRAAEFEDILHSAPATIAGTRVGLEWCSGSISSGYRRPLDPP